MPHTASETNRAAVRGNFLHGCLSRNSCPWESWGSCVEPEDKSFPCVFPGDDSSSYVRLSSRPYGPRLLIRKTWHLDKGSTLKLGSSEQQSYWMLSGKGTQRLYGKSETFFCCVTKPNNLGKSLKLNSFGFFFSENEVGGWKANINSLRPLHL